MAAASQPVRELRDVDALRFHREVLPVAEPAVLRGVAARWPAVAHAKVSSRAIADYIGGFGASHPVNAFFGAPSINGRFFYNESLDGFNFERRDVALGELLKRLLELEDEAAPPAIYAGAIPLKGSLTRLADENGLLLLDPQIEQLKSVWIGNRTRTAAHWDLPMNIACVVAGRRRFTLFPPEQLENLYLGPIDFTLAGQPISLVDPAAPDFERFPRFATALEHARVVELAPGDALFLPSLWFHQVESLDAFGVLINFWWRDAKPWMYSPQYTLLHALLSIRDLPPAERRNWKRMFEHYIFKDGEHPMAHVPEAARGVMRPMTQLAANRLRAFLLKSLGGDAGR